MDDETLIETETGETTETEARGVGEGRKIHTYIGRDRTHTVIQQRPPSRSDTVMMGETSNPQVHTRLTIHTIRVGSRTRRRHEGIDTSAVLSNTGRAAAVSPSGVSGLGVSDPVLGEPALKLTGLSPFTLPLALPFPFPLPIMCESGDGTGVNDAGGGFHDAR